MPDIILITGIIAAFHMGALCLKMYNMKCNLIRNFICSQINTETLYKAYIHVKMNANRCYGVDVNKIYDMKFFLKRKKARAGFTMILIINV